MVSCEQSTAFAIFSYFAKISPRRAAVLTITFLAPLNSRGHAANTGSVSPPPCSPPSRCWHGSDSNGASVSRRTRLNPCPLLAALPLRHFPPVASALSHAPCCVDQPLVARVVVVVSLVRLTPAVAVDVLGASGPGGCTCCAPRLIG